jgi:hypothetical protein
MMLAGSLTPRQVLLQLLVSQAGWPDMLDMPQQGLPRHTLAVNHHYLDIALSRSCTSCFMRTI